MSESEMHGIQVAANLLLNMTYKPRIASNISYPVTSIYMYDP